MGKIGWPSAMAEWVDNAFDRHATRVSFVFEKNFLTIQDDGEGTPTPHAIVQPGHHTPSSDGLGEFGVGGSESLLWAGGEKSSVLIVSTHRGMTRELQMNWTEYARSEWELPDPSERPALPGEIGTRIQVTPVKATRPRSFDALCAELGYIYSHAIRRENKQIAIKTTGGERPRLVLAWTPPPFDMRLRQVNEVIHVGKRTATVRAGVVAEGARNERYGITYWYRYRVVLPNSVKGCGSFNPTRVSGFVELLDGWKSNLGRRKDEIALEAEELFAEVERVMRPVLEDAERAGSTFTLNELSQRLESRIAAALNPQTPDSKARRPGDADQEGAVDPTNTGRKHKRAAIEQPGSRFSGASGGRGVRIAYQNLGGDSVGECKPPFVILNLDNSFISEATKRADDDALIVVVAALIADWDAQQPDSKGQRYFRGVLKSFAEQFGVALKASPALDGRQLLAKVAQR